MYVNNGFILNVPNHLKPSYRISPFQTKDLIVNRLEYLSNNNADEYFKNRYINKQFIYTENGRSALEKAILVLNLQKKDTVTIFTTTSNLYISSCVTQKIEKHCNWSRQVEKSTKAILINHEFGYCVEDMEYYQSLGYPIIEDFAHSFSASNSIGDAGKYADFLIFSLSKFFAVQMGGVLVYDKKYVNIKDDLEKTKRDYILKNLSRNINNIDKINKKRFQNFNIYRELFSSIGLTSTLSFNRNNVPAVFMFNIDDKVDLNIMKIYINNHGIESSIFYGKKSYFVPSHQNLEEDDIKYIFTVIKSFLEGCKGCKG
mgnify:CR=1 FL=1|jgi:hypothetical protein